MFPTADLNLDHLIQIERRQLKALGEAWITSGASYFCLSDASDRVLFAYPDAAPHARVLPNHTTVFLSINGQKVGSLCAGIPFSEAAQARLKADAALINRLVGLEWEIESMTGELIDVQDQLLALYRLTQSVRGQLDLHDTLRTLAYEAAQLVKADGAFMALLHHADFEIIQHPVGFKKESILKSVIKIVFQDGRELLISDPDMLSTITNLFIVPIHIRGEVVASLGLVNKPFGFNAPDMKKARAIAEDAGAQIEKVLLYQETLSQARLKAELDMAADIQNNLLPQVTPRIEGLDVAGASVQAKQVGGDFYDFVGQSDESLVFTVCDVAGKGMSSALLMAMTRIVIRTHVHSDPGTVLTQSNADLYEDFTRVGKFATAIVGRFDTQAHCIDYANAGHSPVIYCPAGGVARLLEAPDMPLGILPDIVYTDLSIPFAPGDVLVVATDGFSEATNVQGEMFGYERLLMLIQEHAGDSARQISDTLFQAIQVFSSGHLQDDDQTLVVIKGITVPHKTVQLVVPSAHRYLAQVSETIADVFAHHDSLPNHQQTVYNIQLAVQEACTNIVDHAHQGDENLPIHIRLTITSRRIEVQLVDHGTPFDITRTPRPDLDTPHVRGYGLFLIHQFMDDVGYESKPDGNYWRLVKYF